MDEPLVNDHISELPPTTGGDVPQSSRLIFEARLDPNEIAIRELKAKTGALIDIIHSLSIGEMALRDSLAMQEDKLV